MVSGQRQRHRRIRRPGQPENILAQPSVRELIDFDRPIGLLLVSMLHFVADDEAPDDPADFASDPAKSVILAGVGRRR